MAPSRPAAVGSPARRLKVEQQRSTRGETDSDPSSKLRDSHLQGGETIDLVQYVETESVTVTHSFVGFPSAKPIRHINTPKPEVFSTRVSQQASRVSKPVATVNSKPSSPQRRGIHFSAHPETQRQLSELYTGIMESSASRETSVPPAHQKTTAAAESPEKTPARKRAREDDEWAKGGATPTKKALTDHPSATTVPKALEAGSMSTSKEGFAEKRRRGREQYLQAEIDQLRREKDAAEQRAKKAEDKEDWLQVKLEESKRRNREAGKAKLEHEQRGMELANVKVRCAALSDGVDKLRADKVKLREEMDKLRDEQEKLEKTNLQQKQELESAKKKNSELKNKLESTYETISKMKKHFETFKTGSSRAMKKVKGKACMISKRICGLRDELETGKKSRDEGTQAKSDLDQAKTERAIVRQQLDLRNSFDQEMGEGEPEPEPATSTTHIDTGTFGRPSDFRKVDMPMSDVAAAAATTPRNNTGTFGRPSYHPQTALPIPDAAPVATSMTTKTTPISTGTFGRPSYPLQADTPMSDVATKPTGHSNNNGNNYRRSFKIQRPNSSRQRLSNRWRTVRQQLNRVSRLTHFAGFKAPPPTGPCGGGFNRGQQQQSSANSQPQRDMAMTDDVKANIDHTFGGRFGFSPFAPPNGPRSGGSGHYVREQRPSSSKLPELDTHMTDTTGSSSQSNKPLRSIPPSEPRVSEFGNRSGKEDEEQNRSSRAAELDKPMPDATDSNSRGNGSLPTSATSGQAPSQLGVESRRIEDQRRIDNETKKLNQRLDNITAKPTTSSTEWRWSRYRI
ncbi:hypothetical protein KC331_g8800 [Hortaea werneckii]|uniref:Uncharacterized protein n=1 Tax=Hortaea werneckii TaxID=91943 RepID=A0A3M7BU73_HORWE|nr:hypothetical protein KC331_g8800 [Hortaea werneckii]KAI7718089.1 hypothetical protein KC353_g4052 [Hortaea werneckii]RMY43382.1 hypothetical protein D0865_11292 [Hortaea werneckii]